MSMILYPRLKSLACLISSTRGYSLLAGAGKIRYTEPLGYSLRRLNSNWGSLYFAQMITVF
jgi:hypothetical protein